MGSAQGILTVGVDVGQKRDPTAIAVVRPSQRPRLPFAGLSPDLGERERFEMATAMIEAGTLSWTGPTETHFETLFLRRLPLGTPYPEMARAVATVCRNVLTQAGGTYPRLFVDATGVGGAFLDMLRAERPPAVLVPVYFTHGDRLTWRREGEPPAMVYGNRHGRRDTRPWVISMGKAWLVTRLQGLFEARRIHLDAGDTEAEAMQRELASYAIKKTDVDNERYGAFDVGEHDDLVTALGLATIEDPGPPSERAASRSEAILPGAF